METQDFASLRPCPDFEATLLQTARQHLGTPYKWGVTDCSWHTQTTYAKLGITIPRVSYHQHAHKQKHRLDSRLWHLRFFSCNGTGKVTHAALLFNSEDGQFLNHASARKGVIEVLFNEWWQKREVR